VTAPYRPRGPTSTPVSGLSAPSADVPARPAPLIVSTGLFVGPVLSRARRARRPCSTTSGPTSPTTGPYARCRGRPAPFTRPDLSGPTSTRPPSSVLDVLDVRPLWAPFDAPVRPWTGRQPNDQPDSPVRPSWTWSTPVLDDVLDVDQHARQHARQPRSTRYARRGPRARRDSAVLRPFEPGRQPDQPETWSVRPNPSGYGQAPCGNKRAPARSTL